TTKVRSQEISPVCNLSPLNIRKPIPLHHSENCPITPARLQDGRAVRPPQQPHDRLRTPFRCRVIITFPPYCPSVGCAQSASSPLLLIITMTSIHHLTSFNRDS